MKTPIVAAMVILLSFIACSKDNNKAPRRAQADTPAYGDVFMEASLGDASNLIPILASDSFSHGVAGLIYNGLVKYDKDFTVVPDLAESWDIEQDGKLIRFHLRRGVRWHDGRPFTARDVLFTYRLVIDPKTPTAYAGDFKQVKSVKMLDDYTVEVTYDTPFAPALISWGMSVLPEHLLKGQDITRTPLARAPVGTGPYRFKSWQPGSRIVLAHNPDYFEGRPRLDGLVYRIIPDDATQFLELKSGNIDIKGLTPLQYLRQTGTPDFNALFTKYRYLDSVYTFLGFNLKRPPFDDIRVRRAIAHAIDKDEIIKGVLYGQGLATTGPYKPGTRWYNPDVPKYAYDPATARALLAESGFKDTNTDGILEKNSRPFTFTIITNQGNPLREKTAQIIQQRLKYIGIDTKIRIVEWTVFLKDFVDPGNFDAVILGWTITPDPDAFDVWHSSNIGPKKLNFIGFSNAQVDDLLDKARHTFDEKERKAYYDRFQVILAREQPYVFLYAPYALPAVSSRIKGIVPAPAGISYNFNEWYVPKGRQKYSVVP
ncbi:MAG TPA: peptide-binding protein [Deltaproteobacteria bacterium]|nr:peptide-binding protein [Deltaproteobacteria bacterium]